MNPLPRKKLKPFSTVFFKSFLPPLALYGLLGLIMHAFNKNDNEVEEES